KQLRMVQSFDPSVFINRAVDLVTGDLIYGVLLALFILWVFVRNWRATLLTALAIPASLLATFIVLQFTGRSLNVISLAALAFAVGMVLDAAVVVMENIIRLRERGENAENAAEQGANQVWGALMASTLTAVAVFMPVFFLKDIEGQLFGDLALTIAIAVCMSMLVAVTVLPIAARYGLKVFNTEDKFGKHWDRMTALVMRLTSTGRKRATVIATLLLVPTTITWLALPSLDYLPPIKRDAVDAFFQFPPGANINALEKDVVNPIVERLAPYMAGEKQPALKNYYILIGNWGGTIGVRVKDEERLQDMVQIVRNEILIDLPDTRAFANQGELFGGFGGARNVELHLQSRDNDALLAAARRGMEKIQQVIPGANVQPQPGLDVAEPQLRLTPDDRRINEEGWTRRELGTIVRALGDGMFVGEYFDGDKRKDVIVRSEQAFDPETLADAPLFTPAGNVVPLRDLVGIEQTVGPTRLLRVDRSRTVSLNVSPPEGWSLEQTIATLKADIEPELRGLLPAGANIQYGGNADQLEKAIRTMGGNFLLALLVLFLVLCALFRSVKDGALVMLTLPLATVGGVIALRLLNLFTFQPLDVLTMIGFIILIGLVINNAILLVDQTRTAERNGLSRHHAVEQAVRWRLRPIFISSLTGLVGTLPLVVTPGEGSVIYRGLATVITGGMAVSTVFTLLLLPCLLRLGETKLILLELKKQRTEQPLDNAA
ncbi:MAG TPA: efflux RND transporter permease subunit, partial [Permianibacter sp.]|nr:efflux RND transporter permease subunit [Permianibacter sp.]